MLAQNLQIGHVGFGVQFLICQGYFAVASLWLNDKRFNDVIPAEISSSSSASPVYSQGPCALLCKRQTGCKGFFYNGEKKTCVVTSSVYLYGGSTETNVVGSRYYRLTPVTCPSDGTYVLHEDSGTCFKVMDVTSTWTNARDTCNTMQGRLASLDSRGKEDALMGFFRAGHPFVKFYHIGGLRPYSEWGTPWPNGQPDFVWMSGQPVVRTPAYWPDSEPSNNDKMSENILVIYHSADGWMLGDAGDTTKYYFVCEFSLF